MLSEEIASARTAIDSTLMTIKAQLTTLNAKISTALGDLEASGINSNLSYLGSLHEQGATVDTNLRSLNQQRSHMKQILLHIELIRNS